jgi:hypothetical protein
VGIVMKKIYQIPLLFIVLIIANAYPIISASSETDTVFNIPNIDQLKVRIKQLYEAEINSNWRTWYDLSTLSLKAVPKDYPKELSCTYEEFEKEFTNQRNDNFKIVSWHINKINLREKPDQMTITVAVEMDVVTQEISKEPKKSKGQTDYWMYIDNAWYWTWRGWPCD